MHFFLIFLHLLPLFHCERTEASHDFHLSKCDIAYNKDAGSLEVSLSIFIDDLELALSKNGHNDLFLCTDREVEKADEYIFEYIQRHLIIKVDGRKLNDIEWVGKEVSDDLAAVWCYIEFRNVTPVKQVSVHYDLLMEVFEDQQNIVKMIMSPRKKAYFLLSLSERSGNLEL